MNNKLLSLISISLLLNLLLGCASTPEFDITQVDKALTPQSVIAEPETSQGKIALWGGTILDTKNLKDSKPLGRFIIQHKGYLEPTTYSQGRLLTVLGNIGESQTGKVGESEYSYPVINSQQLHLWSLDGDKDNTSFHFGLGIRL